MHSPIIFIASKDLYDESDATTQRKLLGQDNLNENDVFDLLSNSGSGADYVVLSNGRQWNPEDVFEGDTLVEIIDKSKDDSIATLKVNKEAYFKTFVQTLGEYYKIVEKRLKNGDITFGFHKGDSEEDYRTIYAFKQLKSPYGGVQFILNGDEVYNIEELFGDYMEAEYYINLAYAGDYHF